MLHYYIHVVYKNKETSKIWQEAKVLPKLGVFKPNDPTIKSHMDVVGQYLTEHIKMNGEITEVKITDGQGRVPKEKKEDK